MIKKEGFLNHAITHIVITFLLTSIVGTLLTATYQKRNWQYQQSLLLLEKEKDKSEEIFTYISKLLDRRLYNYRQIYYALNPNNNKDGLSSKYKSYHNTLNEWNQSLNKNLAYLELYFSKAIRDKFENDISKDFINLGIKLNDAKYSFPNVENRDELVKDINKLNEKVYEFNLLMLQSIKNDKRQIVEKHTNL